MSSVCQKTREGCACPKFLAGKSFRANFDAAGKLLTAKLRREKLPLSRSSGKRKLEPSWPSIKLSSKLVSWEEKLSLSTPPWGQAVKGLGPLRRLKLLFVSRAGLSSFESSGVKVLL